MSESETESLCQSVSDAIHSARARFQVLEGRDLLALQSEMLEWLSDWQNMEIMWCDDFNED